MLFNKQSIFLALRPVLFLIGLVLFLMPLGVVLALFNEPSGIHHIRQADSLSFALNYRLFDFNFFHPQNFNLISEDGKCGSEFPIFYYLAALFSYIGWNTAFILKLIHATVFFGGIYQLWRKAAAYFKSSLLSTLLVLTGLSSTVILYYSNNYLPDIAALGLTIGAISTFYFCEKPNKHSVYFTSAIFALATMVKITYGIYPIAWLCALAFKNINTKASLKPTILAGIGFVIPVISWWVFIKYYNQQAGNNYYFNTFLPIWQSSKDQIDLTSDLILNYWKNSYYPSSTQILASISFFTVVFFYKQLSTFRRWLLALSLLGIIAYIVLFFEKFRDHDYYFLVLVPFVFLIFIEAIKQFQTQFFFKFKKLFIICLLGIFAISGYSYVYKKLPNRFPVSDSQNTLGNSEAFQLKEIKAFLNEKDQVHNLEVLVVGDSTMNNSLALIERKGWQYPVMPVSHEDIIREEDILKAGAIVLLRSPAQFQPELIPLLDRYCDHPLPLLWLRKN